MEYIIETLIFKLYNTSIEINNIQINIQKIIINNNTEKYIDTGDFREDYIYNELMNDLKS